MSANSRQTGRSARFEAIEARRLLSVTPVSTEPIQHTPAEILGDISANDALSTYAVDWGAASVLATDTINAQGWNLSGAGQTVVVIDSGIAYTHEALGGGLGDGYRVVGGWDFAESDANPYDDGYFGSHGTHVTGILAGNSSDFQGVAPDVDLVALRVFDDNGYGQFEWVESALDWTLAHLDDFENPITTINLSIGAYWNDSTTPDWATLEDELAALEDAGIFIAVAAGNSFNRFETAGLSYPASSDYVVPVAATDGQGNISARSQRAPGVIAAPGESIRSTVPDYMGNHNGIDDDYAAYSGTSMSTPMVAGAAVLVREAFWSIGVTDVDQARIYDVLQSTADIIYDPATRMYYSELNLDRALDAILPDSPTPATPTIPAEPTVPETPTPVDPEEPAPLQPEEPTPTEPEEPTPVEPEEPQPTEPTQPATPTPVEPQEPEPNEPPTPTPVEPETPTPIEPETPPAEPDAGDLGLVDQGTFDITADASGTANFTITTTRAGVLTVEVIGGPRNVVLEVVDADGNVLQSITPSVTVAGSTSRVDVQVTAGANLAVRIASTGSLTGAKLRVTNLLTIDADGAHVAGTDGADRFEVFVGPRTGIVVGGVTYDLTARRVSLEGGNGDDRITVYGNDANERIEFTPERTELTARDYALALGGFENQTIFGGGGTDTAFLTDSRGNDIFEASPGVARFYGATFDLVLERFEQIQASATRGGMDTAILIDSSGDDLLVAAPERTMLTGAGYYHEAAYFDEVLAESVAGGADQAYLYDSSGNDHLILSGDAAIFSGDGFTNRARGFTRTIASATSGGHDTAAISGRGRGDEHLRAEAASVWLDTEDAASWLYGFDHVLAEAIAGGNDTAEVAAVDFLLDLDGEWRDV